jgi:hypothetical protein
MPDRTYAWSASGTTRTSSFFLTTGNISGCDSACGAMTEGFFAGASAERAGVAYHILDSGAGVVGAAAFQRQ